MIYFKPHKGLINLKCVHTGYSRSISPSVWKNRIIMFFNLNLQFSCYFQLIFIKISEKTWFFTCQFREVVEIRIVAKILILVFFNDKCQIMMLDQFLGLFDWKLAKNNIFDVFIGKNLSLGTSNFSLSAEKSDFYGVFHQYFTFHSFK